jgi:hypothetical protein
MRVCARPGDPKSPGAIWEVYAPSEMGGTPPRFARRSIACSDDGHWVFEQFGEPYPFEDLERYRAKRNRDRFDAALLQCYLREFGLDAFSDDFYRVDASSPAILIEDGVRYDFKEFTLAEVVAGRPWVR